MNMLFATKDLFLFACLDTNAMANKPMEFHNNPFGGTHVICDDKVFPKIRNSYNYILLFIRPKNMMLFFGCSGEIS